jgi:hypothetical protein
MTATTINETTQTSEVVRTEISTMLLLIQLGRVNGNPQSLASCLLSYYHREGVDRFGENIPEAPMCDYDIPALCAKVIDRKSTFNDSRQALEEVCNAVDQYISVTGNEIAIGNLWYIGLEAVSTLKTAAESLGLWIDWAGVPKPANYWKDQR